MEVVVYSKPNCPQCDLTKRDMDILGIEYRVVDISQDSQSLDRLMARGNHAAPVVETPLETWSGYNREKIKSLVSYD